MKKQSEIHGTGYGDSHTWSRIFTTLGDLEYYEKFTSYSCKCGADFNHYYDVTPDIFKAIKESGVPDKCPLK